MQVTILNKIITNIMGGVAIALLGHPSDIHL